MRVVGRVLLGLGAFLLVAAVVAVTWAPGVAKRTPLDTDTTTRLTGTALVPTKEDAPFDVRATSVSEVDSEASDDDAAVFVTYSCLVKAESEADCGTGGTGEDTDPNIVSISSDRFVTDRRTGEALRGEGYLPDGVESDHEGLVNKWPFDAQQRDYDYWDGILQRAVTATFEGTRDIDGLETYEYHVQLDEEPAVVIGDVEGLYTMDKTIWVEPRTGAIVDQAWSEQRTTPDGETLLDLDIAFTDEQVASNVAGTGDRAASLDLIDRTIPLIGFIAGPLLVLAGLALLLLGRRRGRQRHVARSGEHDPRPAADLTRA